MQITKAKYLTSVVDKKAILSDNIAEFAFVGRSNVGKSSLINCLVNQKLVKTSSTPGHTRMINYFSINDDKFRFVDLPGYGYAKAGKQNQILWSTLMEDYLCGSNQIKRVFVLVDIRHEPNELDNQMIMFLFQNLIPFTVVATKCDKIAKSKQTTSAGVIASKLHVGRDNIIVFSSETSVGREFVLNQIEKDIQC